MTKELLSVSLIGARVDRPTPWVEARLAESEVSPALILDRVKYFDATVVDALNELVDEEVQRITAAQRERRAAGL